MRHYRFSPVFSVLLSLAYPSAASAQVNWWRVDSESGVSLELSKINLRHFEGARFFTSVGFLGTQNAVSKSVSIVTDLPYASYDADNAYWINWYINQGRYNDLPSHSVLANLSFTDQFVVGNPYLGIEVSKPDNQRLYRIGVRLPTVTGTHARASVLATFGAWDRFEAFAPKVLTFSFEAGIRTRPTSNQRVAQFLIGPTFMVPDWSRVDLFIDYWTFVGPQSPKAHGGLTFSGRFHVNENDVKFLDRFVHHIGVVAGLTIGRFEPGVHVKIPLDADLHEIIDLIWGIDLRARL